MRPDRLVRIILAILLATAAGLKFRQSAQGSWAQYVADGFPAFHAAVILGELLLAVLLITDFCPHVLHWTAAAVFFGFLQINLIALLNGQTHCECFGPLRLQLWLVLTVDVVAVLALCNWHPKRQPTEAAA